MRAMVLAAGLGTRLRPLTDERPKPAVPVGNRPLAWFAIDHLTRFGVGRIAMNTFHLGERLPDLLAPHLPEALEVTYVPERRLLGTGGGIRHAAPHLLEGDAPVLVMNADILFAPDLEGALETHRRLGAVATMVLRPDPQAERYGAVEVDLRGRVRRLLGEPAGGAGGGMGEAGELTTTMFTGVHVLSRRAFDDLPEEGCIVRHAYRRWVDRGEVVAGFIDPSPWRDLGTLPQYLEANLELVRGGSLWPGADAGRQAGRPSAIVDPRARIGRDAVLRHCVIGPGASVASGVVVERTVVWPDARVASDVREAVVTPRAVVPVSPCPSPSP